MANILVVEDDLTFSQLLQDFLRKYGHDADAAREVKSAVRLLAQTTYDLLLLDYRLPDGNGLEVLAKARENGAGTPAIVMTSFNDVRTAVKAMRSGAFDYITKPVNPDELLMIMAGALGPDKTKIVSARSEQPDFIRGQSPQSDKLYEYISLVAPTDMSVMIQGESGTGKEHAARCIHLQSKRAQKPFVAVDCGALSKELAASELFGHIKGAFTGAVLDKKGLFEAAEGGTLFLDEVGNLSYDVQVKLLRALQEKIVQSVGSTKPTAVDVRIITATNEDLTRSVHTGSFRQDLYHRINEFKIQMPALRDRGEDMDLFIQHFVRLSNTELERQVKTISPEVRDILNQYDWPGNLRELKNVIKRMVLLTKSEVAGVDALPEEMLFSIRNIPQAPPSDLKALNEANEKVMIEKILQQVKFNKSKAAKLLNIDRKTLYSKLDRYGIN
jgi:two-component system response regulator HydG